MDVEEELGEPGDKVEGGERKGERLLREDAEGEGGEVIGGGNFEEGKNYRGGGKGGNGGAQDGEEDLDFLE